MQQYIQFLKHILSNGVKKSDRTGTGTLSTFGYQMRFDLQQGFPLMTTKKVHTKSIIYELLWFLRGDSNLKYLQQHGVSIWNEWADPDGNLGPIYGKQWRNWETKKGQSIDQISNLIEGIKQDPDSRRHIVNAWNVGELAEMALSPCHILFQFYVANGKLSCQLYQRSADAFLGVPFNIASYALLVHMIAQQCALDVGEFIWTGGDCHLYLNHLPQANIQILRERYPLPRLKMNQKNSINDYQYEDFQFIGYQSHPHIKAPVAI